MLTVWIVLQGVVAAVAALAVWILVAGIVADRLGRRRKGRDGHHRHLGARGSRRYML